MKNIKKRFLSIRLLPAFGFNFAPETMGVPTAEFENNILRKCE